MNRPVQQRASFVGGGRPGVRPWSWATAGTIAFLLVVIALPLRGLYRATGSSMEEAFMIVFPRLVGQGKVPNVDFLHLYGPGSLHVLWGWFELFGDRLEVQRTFGLLQHLSIIFALYALTRPWGRITALLSSLVATLMVLTPIGLSALAWHGGVGLALWAIVFGLRADRSSHPTLSRALSGFLAGLALSFRPDLVLGLGISLGWWWWSRRREGAVWPLGAGLAVGLLPMWVHLAMAGIPAAVEGMVIDPVFRLRDGRELPRPPSWDRLDGALQFVAELIPPWWGPPAPSAEKQLFFWFWTVILIAIAVPAYAIWVRRRTRRSQGTQSTQSDGARTRGDLRNDVLVVAGLFGLGILPQAMQRPDSTHLAWVACVSWPLAVAAITDALQRFRPTTTRLQRHVTAGFTLAILMFVICPFFTYRHWVLHTRVSIGQLPVPHLVERDERRFWFGDPVAADALRTGVSVLDEISEPGDRLLVGPADLSRTIYSDVSVYYLFPELEPATYFIEMDPGLANADDSGLADDVSSADFLFLTNLWTGWWEPNTSADSGSQLPNQVVADEFCLVGSWNDDMVMLFERCPGGGGFNPAEVAEIPIPADAAGS